MRAAIKLKYLMNKMEVLFW